MWFVLLKKLIAYFIKYAPVQVEVMELVCCPAKRAAMSIPVHSSSVVPRPKDRYLESMKACNISGSVLPEAFRSLMTLEKIAASSFRALKRHCHKLALSRSLETTVKESSTDGTTKNPSELDGKKIHPSEGKRRNHIPVAALVSRDWEVWKHDTEGHHSIVEVME